MAGYLNQVQLIGNLGRDPDVRSTQSGGKIVTLSIATTESWTDKRSGEKRERTEWHRVVVFSDGLATVVERYLQKGSKVFVQGALQTRKWTDQDGKDRYSTEVVLQPFNGKLIMLDGTNGRESARGDSGRPAAGNNDAPRGGDLDDEIPF
jgi:single-strand DNA-binding protein